MSPRFQASRRALARAAIVVVLAWMAWAFADEAWTSSRLAGQASELRQRNAMLQAQNDQYQRDIATVESGAAGEEVARENGYAKPGERIYVVASPPPGPASTAAGPGGPATPAARPPRVTVHGASPGLLEGIGRWWRGLGPGRGR